MFSKTVLFLAKLSMILAWIITYNTFSTTKQKMLIIFEERLYLSGESLHLFAESLHLSDDIGAIYTLPSQCKSYFITELNKIL